VKRQVLFYAIFTLGFAALAVAQDSDLPLFLRDRGQDGDYLRRRAEYVAFRRGLYYSAPYNSRARAIREMEAQEGRQSLLDSVLNAAPLPPWTPLGPTAIPNFGNPAVSGRVTAIAVHPTNPGKVYVGTANGGLYRSLDGGASWTPLMDGALSLAIGSVAIDPADPTRVWVGTGEANESGDSFDGVGVYRITSAESATPTLEGPFNLDASSNPVLMGQSISKIIINASNPNTIFVAAGQPGLGPFRTSYAGLYRSQNALAAAPTFAALDLPTGAASWPVVDAVAEPGNPDNLVCAVQGDASTAGVWRTTNANAASPTFSRTLALAYGQRAALAIDKVGSTVTVLVAAAEPVPAPCPAGDQGTLRRSVDGGATFGATLAAANGFCGPQCWYDLAVAVDPSNAGQIYIGGVSYNCGRAVAVSGDGGASFNRTDTGVHTDTHAFAVAPSLPSTIYTGNDGGIYKSTDYGSTWTSLNGPSFSATQFESIAYHPSDRQFMIGGTQDNGTLMKQPDGSWLEADGGDGGSSLIDRNAVDTVTVDMYHTFFNRSNPNGLIGFDRAYTTACASQGNWAFRGCGNGTFSQLNCDGVPYSATNGISCDDSVLFYAPMALGPGFPDAVYFGTNRLYRSADRGDTMVPVSQQLGFLVDAIGIAPDNDNIRLVGSDSGIFLTTTGASTLSNVSGPIPYQYFTERIKIDPQNHDVAYVAIGGYGLPAGQHVWKTTNLTSGAPTWVAAGSGIPDVPVESFAIDGTDTQHLFAGTDIGVFTSIDGGASWTPFSNGLPRVPVFDMAFQDANRVLRIATHGRGIWEVQFSAMTGLSFYTVSPCRVFDTRSTTPMARGEIRLFQVSGLCGIPTTAVVISANLTLVTGGNGYVSVFAGGAPVPSTSTVNFRAGRPVIANNATVQLAADGSGTLNIQAVFNQGVTNVILDVNGYYQ
jgi:hypothetical protein